MILLRILSPLRVEMPQGVRNRPAAVGPRALLLVIALALWLPVGGFPVARGQGAGRIVDPRQYGIDLAPGPLQVTQGNCVATMDEHGTLVVGRLYAQVGDGAVVLLPDGALVPRKRDEFSLTDRKFEPFSRDVLTKRLREGEFKDFKIRQSKHYVYVYRSSEQFGLGTSRILESMLDGVIKQARACGLAVREPELPLIVVMFADKAEFQKFRPVPDDVTAYYHPLSNRVFLHEPRELGELSRELAVSQAISTVAHEGAHQILHNIGVQQRLAAWPMWISEGLAEYFAPTTFGKNLTWKGPRGGNDLRLFELQRYLADRPDAPPPDGRVIEETVTAPTLTSAGYASAWALTSFLITRHKPQFKEFLGEVSRLGPMEGIVAGKGELAVMANLKQFQNHFGQDSAALETELIAYLKNLPYRDPFANLPHFLAQVVAPVGGRPHYRAGTFYSSVAAENWAERTVAALQPGATRNVIRFENRADAEAFKKLWLSKGPPIPVAQD